MKKYSEEGNDAVTDDRRTTSVKPSPVNKLTDRERAQILAFANSEEFANLPPSHIVLTLADRGEYLASESSFYRILKQASQRLGQKHPYSTPLPISSDYRNSEKISLLFS